MQHLSSLRPCGRALVVILLFGCLPVHAHHGRDFLLARSATLPHAGAIYFIPRIAYIKGDEDETELEPSLLWGVNDWMALELHAHAERVQGGSLAYESTAPAVHLRYAPQDSSAWALGLSLEYEIARDSDEADALKTVASLTTRFGDQRVAVVNLIAESVRGEGPEYGYAAGIRWPMGKQLGMGFEFQGDLEGRAEHEGMLGIYWMATEQITLNLGYGAGFDNGPDYTLRSALVWQLR